MANYLQDLQNKSGSYLSQLNQLSNQMKSYGPATASDALKEFSARVGNMAPQYGELRGMESQIQQTPGVAMQQYQQEMGGTTGLDPMARLNAIQAMMGNQQGTANVMRDTIGQQQGRLEQMANNAMNMYQQELAQKQQQYANINDMYKTIAGQIENEKQRQAAARAAELQRRSIIDELDALSAANKSKSYQIAPGGKDHLGNVYPQGGELSGQEGADYKQWLLGQSASLLKDINKKQGWLNFGQNVSLPMWNIASLGLGGSLFNKDGSGSGGWLSNLFKR